MRRICIRTLRRCISWSQHTIQSQTEFDSPEVALCDSLTSAAIQFVTVRCHYDIKCHPAVLYNQRLSVGSVQLGYCTNRPGARFGILVENCCVWLSDAVRRINVWATLLLCRAEGAENSRGSSRSLTSCGCLFLSAGRAQSPSLLSGFGSYLVHCFIVQLPICFM